MAKPPDRVPSQGRGGSGTQSVDAFLARARAVSAPRTHGVIQRIMFAIDATASRQPTWDLACELHDELFCEVERLGDVAVQLVYFRGVGEFSASAWLDSPAALRERMLGVACRGGRTQLVRLLRHAVDEVARSPVRTLIYIGDAFEEAERDLLDAAGQLALRRLPVLIFQEGHDPVAGAAFAAVADRTDGAHVQFESGSAAALRDLLSAAVRYATGGRAALEDFARRSARDGARQLLAQLPR
jgi:hypothetical protein